MAEIKEDSTIPEESILSKIFDIKGKKVRKFRIWLACMELRPNSVYSFPVLRSFLRRLRQGRNNPKDNVLDLNELGLFPMD